MAVPLAWPRRQPDFCRERNRRRRSLASRWCGLRRLHSRQVPGCLRGQARGTANRTPPPNRQPAGRHAPSFPEPGPPEAPLTLTSSTMNNRQEPTRTRTQATVGVEDDRREDDSQPPEERSERGPSHSARVTRSVSVGSYEARHEAQRRTGPWRADSQRRRGSRRHVTHEQPHAGEPVAIGEERQLAAAGWVVSIAEPGRPGRWARPGSPRAAGWG